MGRVKLSREERFVQKYLKKHGKLKVLTIFNKDLEEKYQKDRESSKRSLKIPIAPGRKKSDDEKRKKKQDKEDKITSSSSNPTEEPKPVKLSFAILKAPERKKIELKPVKAKKKVRKIDEDDCEPKTVNIPEDFKKISKRFGLPEEHLDFFYEHRASFNWEFKDKTGINCIEQNCQFKTKIADKCLSEHMISVHDYTEIPCGHVDCSYIAYSRKNLNHHTAKFHGHGKRPTAYGIHSCPYLSCRNSFRLPFQLNRHVNVHKNILLSCNYCPYKVSSIDRLHTHLAIHFDIKNFACDTCSATFHAKNILNVHIRMVHTTDDFECQDCGFQASKLGALQKHRKTCEKRLQYSRIL